MDKKFLKLIVISDLHCHLGSNGDDTYLKSDMLRVPQDSHPVESLLKIKQKDTDFKTDITICPGDFTNKCDQQGFISGWNYVQEINNALNGKEIIATLGNHDVDSHETISNYSLEIAKGVKKGFPLENENECDTFWSKGCVFLERENFRILVINSSHFHYNKSNSASGKVDHNLLDYVRDYLDSVNDDKIQIALSHHHPYDHSRLELGEEDKIVNGAELLEILCQFKFDLFIHGHKHDALLRNYPLAKYHHTLPILSAGSFSAKSNISFTSMRNQFHQVEIIKAKGSRARGSIKTWTFLSRQGWKLSYDDEAFPPYSGFGFDGIIRDLVLQIEQLIEHKTIMGWKEVVENVPDIEFLIPTEERALEEALENKKLAIHRDKSTNYPECIFKKEY